MCSDWLLMLLDSINMLYISILIVLNLSLNTINVLPCKQILIKTHYQYEQVLYQIYFIFSKFPCTLLSFFIESFLLIVYSLRYATVNITLQYPIKTINSYLHTI